MIDMILNNIKIAVSIAIAGGTVKLLRKLAAMVVMRVVKKEKKKIVALLNAKVDLPKLNEAQEKQILDSLYDAMVATLSAILTNK